MKFYLIFFVFTILLNISAMENSNIKQCLNLQFLIPNLIDDKGKFLSYDANGEIINKFLERAVKSNFLLLNLIIKFQDKLVPIKKTHLEPENISYDFEAENNLLEKINISLGAIYIQEIRFPVLFGSKEIDRITRLKFFNTQPIYLNFYLNDGVKGNFPEHLDYEIYNLKWQDELIEKNKAAISFQISKKFNYCPFFKEFQTTLLELQQFKCLDFCQELSLYTYELEPDNDNKIHSIFLICWAKQGWHKNSRPEFIMPVIIYRECDLNTNKSKIKIFNFFDLKKQLEELIFKENLKEVLKDAACLGRVKNIFKEYYQTKSSNNIS